MQSWKIAILVSVAVVLGACARPEISCTVKLPQRPAGVGDQIVAGSMVDGIEISGTIKSNDSSLIPDASAMTVDVSQSNVTFPSSGNVTLTIRGSSGSVVASRTFGWTRGGGVLSFSNPSSINSWLSGSGAAVSSSRIEYSLDGISVPAVEGQNVVSASVQMYSQTIASASGSFSGGRGGGGCSSLPGTHCVIQ